MIEPLSSTLSQPVQLHHIGVVVPDLEAAKKLFATVLGLELVREADHSATDGPRAAWFACGPCEIELVEYAEHDPARGAPVPRIDHLALSLSGLAAAAEALASHGVRLDGEPLDTGEATVAFTDPATTQGLRLQLVAPC
jgi:catechol 2,3-dioxygenase-like lactoylglutathione lyase family enzyme